MAIDGYDDLDAARDLLAAVVLSLVIWLLLSNPSLLAADRERFAVLGGDRSGRGVRGGYLTGSFYPLR
jgi:hypothetical protein